MKYLKPLILTFVLLFAFSINIDAQQHLNFMEIPIDGKIDDFQKQLYSKGFLPETEYNKKLTFGQRAFSGKIKGRSCILMVFYTKTKTVFRVKFGYQFYSSESSIKYFNEEKDSLSKLYIYAKTNLKKEGADLKYHFDIYKSNDYSANSLGDIELILSPYKENGITYYNVMFDYVDFDNVFTYIKENPSIL